MGHTNLHHSFNSKMASLLGELRLAEDEIARIEGLHAALPELRLKAKSLHAAFTQLTKSNVIVSSIPPSAPFGIGRRVDLGILFLLGGGGCGELPPRHHPLSRTSVCASDATRIANLVGRTEPAYPWLICQTIWFASAKSPKDAGLQPVIRSTESVIRSSVPCAMASSI